VNREQVSDWVAAYERAWRAPGTGALAGIFTQDATYRQSPYEEPITGLPAIAAMWDAERGCPAPGTVGKPYGAADNSRRASASTAMS